MHPRVSPSLIGVRSSNLIILPRGGGFPHFTDEAHRDGLFSSDQRLSLTYTYLHSFIVSIICLPGLECKHVTSYLHQLHLQGLE